MNYYNDFDAEACAKLRHLVAIGAIPPGVVDDRSIDDISPSELSDYDQCHFFAGIGGWPRALYLASIPSDTKLWTGSCPCQPYSAAGKGKGAADQRHLWPAWFHLIEQCRPPIIYGEQVAPAIGYGWLDGVCDDLEGVGYACGAAVLPACAVNSPQKRERLFFVAHRDGIGTQIPIARRLTTEQELCRHHAENRPWDGAVGIRCADGKVRRTQPGTPLLAHGVRRAMGMTNQFGNAIVPPLAAAFITSTHGGVQ